MNWPWNVRVVPMLSNFKRQNGFTRPEYYHVAVRIKGTWVDAGTAKTWFEAFLQGLVS